MKSYGKKRSVSNSRIPDITVSLFFISFTLILLTLGGGGTFYSAGKLGKNFLFVFTGSRTEGKIIAYSGSYTTNNKGNSTKMYTPVIQYTDHTGTVREIETDYSSSSRESNDEATVYYDPVKPARAVRGGFMSLFFWPFLILCFSLMGLSIALYLAKAMIKGLKKPKG